MNKPTLHLMVGLPGSGKTTRAKELEEALGCIRFTPDYWQLLLFGDDTDHPEHSKRHTAVETIIWELAQKLLKQGVSVILDFGFWAREERRFFYEAARQLGVYFQIHRMEAPFEELLERIARRNSRPEEPAFTILPSHMEAWARIFQPITREELLLYSDLLPPVLPGQDEEG